MPQTRPPYPPEFRQRIVELARAGRTVQELAAEFEPSEQTIRDWIVQAHLTVSLYPMEDYDQKVIPTRKISAISAISGFNS